MEGSGRLFSELSVKGLWNTLESHPGWMFSMSPAEGGQSSFLQPERWAPRGVLAVTIWGQKPWLSAWVSAEAHKLGATGSLAETLLADEASLKEALSKAEFESIKIGKETSLFWHQSEETWWQSLWEHGMRARLEQLESKDLEQLKSAALAKAQEIHEERGVP